MTATNEPDGAGQQTAEKPSPNPEGGPQAKPQSRGGGGVDMSDEVGQVGMIRAKGLDLAEAGVSLGVTIVNRIGTAAQQQVLERMAAAMQQRDEPAASPAPMPADAPVT